MKTTNGEIANQPANKASILAAISMVEAELGSAEGNKRLVLLNLYRTGWNLLDELDQVDHAVIRGRA
jgi:hypothetical protein